MKYNATLPSGSMLEIDMAPWDDVGILRRVLAQELKSVDLNLSSTFVSALAAKDKGAIWKAFAGSDVNSFKNLLLQLLSSKPLEDAVFRCMVRGTLNDVQMKPHVFESEAGRADFFPAAWEVIKINLAPFFSSLVSPSTPGTGTSPLTSGPG